MNPPPVGWQQGPKMSRLVYGAWRLADDTEGSHPQGVRAKIETCLELGISTFDHADIYGGYRCEALFGAALAQAPGLRQRMQIVSKCGIKLISPARPEHRIKHYDTSTAHIVASAEASLRALRTDWLDVLLIHRPDPYMDPGTVVAAFDSLHAQGKVRHFGVSNFTPAQVDAVQAHFSQRLCVNQIELSLMRPDLFNDGTVLHCQRAGMVPMAWSPLGGGALFNSDGERATRVRAVLHEVGREVGAAADQVALAWLLAHPAGVHPVLGSHVMARIKSAAGALKVQLDRQQWYALWRASMGHDVP